MNVLVKLDDTHTPEAVAGRFITAFHTFAINTPQMPMADLYAALGKAVEGQAR